jgi:anti-sigma regulatory factor (Ser/Thr protein kinase)
MVSMVLPSSSRERLGGRVNVPRRLQLPQEPTSPAVARRFVGETLHHWGLDRLIDKALLVVNELVENALVHAGSGCEVQLHRGSQVLVLTVIDSSPALPRLTTTGGELRARGRGLHMVENLSDRWGVRSAAHGGKIVWVRLSELNINNRAPSATGS